MSGRNHYKGVPEPLPTKVNINAVTDGPHLDAFARMRFSQPYTLFDSAMNHSDNSELWSAKTFQDAAAEWQPGRSSMFLTVGTSAGDRIFRQSKQYLHYQPGKSQLILMTGVFNAHKTGLSQKIGYFDDDSGIFFCMHGQGLLACVRSSVTGSPVDKVYPQSDWNLDNLLGGGPSGVKLKPESTQIFVMDCEGLGVGRIRFGFVLGGQIVYCHEISNANVDDSVHLSDPDNPCRYEIENVSETSSPSTLEQIWTSVAVEGGYNPKGVIRGADMGVNARTVTSGTDTALLSVRLSSSSYKSFIEPLTYGILSTTKDNIHVQIILNGTLTGQPSWQPLGGSGMEVDTSSIEVVGGERVWSDYISETGGGRLASLEYSESLLRLSTTASGVSDVLTLAASVAGGSPSGDVIGFLNLKQVL